MKHFAALGAFLFCTLILISWAAAACLDSGDLYRLPGREGGGCPGLAVRTGTLPDLERNLGAGDLSVPVAGLTTGSGRHHLSFSYHRADFQGRGIALGGRTLSGEEVGVDLDDDVYDLVYQYDFLDLQNVLSGFSAGVIGQLKLVDGQVARRGASRQTARHFSTPIPLVGMNLHMNILKDLFAGRVRAAGMGDSQGSVFDGRAELSFTPYPFLDIYGGYRFFFINIETDEVALNYGHSGPYVGISLSF